MTIILLLLFLTSITPSNADEPEPFVYAGKKYNYYGKCLDEALPRRINNNLVFECYGKASSEIQKLIKERIESYGNCLAPLRSGSFQCDLKQSQQAFELYKDTECLMQSDHIITVSGVEFPKCHYNLNRDRLIQLDRIQNYKMNQDQYNSSQKISS